MTTQTIRACEDRHAARSIADWLCLAAAPTFALMALLSVASTSGPQMLCTADASPFNGMVAMYMLMSAFHSVPWLKLIAGRQNDRP